MTFLTDLSPEGLESFQNLMDLGPTPINDYLQGVVAAGNTEFAKRIEVLEIGLSDRESGLVEQIQDAAKLVMADPTSQAEQKRLQGLLKTLEDLEKSGQMALKEVQDIKMDLQKQEENVGTLNTQLRRLRAMKKVADSQPDPIHEELQKVGDAFSQYICNSFKK